MESKSTGNLSPAARFGGEAQPAAERAQDLYVKVCDLKELEAAYAVVRADCRNLGIEPAALEALEAEGVAGFLRQLERDLRAKTYQPGSPSTQVSAKSVFARSDVVAVRDLVVQIAIKQVLGPLFAPELPCDPAPEKVIPWLARTIDRGMTRVFATTIERRPGGAQHERLLKVAGERIGDADVIGLLRNVLEAEREPGFAQRGVLGSLLASMAFQGIDRIVQQAKANGREGTRVHVAGAHFGDDLVVLLDDDPRYDWLIPALKKRIREEVSELSCELDAAKTQVVDMARGEKLRFLGYELQRPAGPSGSARVRYRRFEQRSPREPKPVTPEAPRRRWLPRLGFIGHGWTWVRELCRFQWARDALSKVHSIQVGWQHLPITLYPVLGLLFGWLSPVALVCAGLAVICNGLPLAAYARRRSMDVTAGVFALGAVVCLGYVTSDIYANLSREYPAPAWPPGFYMGQRQLSWSTEPVHYGLYVPPHFQTQAGPFPLIVFLHGYGERSKKSILSVGLPRSIATHFGETAKKGRFDFVGFFPIDPTGEWEAGSPEVEGIMKVLDHVMHRHRIDPTRVYLTGHSLGGTGVWRLAEVYPERWAAVAPLCSFDQPEVNKVRHIPAWIFHGAKDKRAPVAPERTLAEQLKKAKADVRYTELPNQGHLIWHEVYDSKDLYDWFAKKSRKSY